MFNVEESQAVTCLPPSRLIRVCVWDVAWGVRRLRQMLDVGTIAPMEWESRHSRACDLGASR